MKIQFLISGPMSPRGRNLLRDLSTGAKKAGIKIKPYSHRENKRSTLVTYGAGAPERLKIVNQYIESGHDAIVWDAGYWCRKLPEMDRYYRVSINHLHPQEFLGTASGRSDKRMKSAGKKVADIRYDKDGPIMLVGNTRKSQAAGAKDWSAITLKRIRAQFPGVPVIYRPKPKRVPEPVAADGISTGLIEQELHKYRLIVCRHSNVAVDACQVGIPVVTEDGAAAAIYPTALEDYDDQPSPERRYQFLSDLAYWQWSRKEMTEGKPWRFIQEVLDGA